MNYINSSATMLKEAIHSFFSINRSLAGTISNWVSSTTVTTLLQNSFSKPGKVSNDDDMLLQDIDYLKAG